MVVFAPCTAWHHLSRAGLQAASIRAVSWTIMGRRSSRIAERAALETSSSISHLVTPRVSNISNAKLKLFVSLRGEEALESESNDDNSDDDRQFPSEEFSRGGRHGPKLEAIKKKLNFEPPKLLRMKRTGGEKVDRRVKIEATADDDLFMYPDNVASFPSKVSNYKTPRSSEKGIKKLGGRKGSSSKQVVKIEGSENGGSLWTNVQRIEIGGEGENEEERAKIGDTVKAEPFDSGRLLRKRKLANDIFSTRCVDVKNEEQGEGETKKIPSSARRRVGKVTVDKDGCKASTVKKTEAAVQGEEIYNLVKEEQGGDTSLLRRKRASNAFVKDEPKVVVGLPRKKLADNVFVKVKIEDCEEESRKAKTRNNPVKQEAGHSFSEVPKASNSRKRKVPGVMPEKGRQRVVKAQGLELVRVSPAGGTQLETEGVQGTITSLGEPYPLHARPFPEECQQAADLLTSLHGHLPEYERHRQSCPTIEHQVHVEPLQSTSPIRVELKRNVRGGGNAKHDRGENIRTVELALTSITPSKKVDRRKRGTVLDSLIGTLLSQNTTDNNSRKAFASLRSAFPTWEQVFRADPKDIVDAIKCGGLAEIKAGRIRTILETLWKERGEISLEYVLNMSTEDIKVELSRFKGVGPKTVACVLMFHLQREEFPVDTHVFRISKMLGWVPDNADREKAYLHLNKRIPDYLKYDLHCLFVTHGKRCPKCAKRNNQKPPDGPCPLLNWKSKWSNLSNAPLAIKSA